MSKSKFCLAALMAMILTGCGRGCAKWEKKNQYGNRSYVVTMYSGGQVVYSDTVKTIVNQEESGADGVYYFKGDTLVEISGDYVIKSVK